MFFGIFFLLINVLHAFTWNSSSSFTLQSLKNAVHDFVDSHQPLNSKHGDITPEFKEILDNGPIPINERQFLINGWRWHTISVIKDLNRFRKLTETSMNRSPLDDERLSKCYNYVFSFNWKALMRVEREIFFPWLSDILPESSKLLIVTVIEKHEKIKTLTEKLQDICVSCNTMNKNNDSMNKILNELTECATLIQNTQEQYIVPYITAYISKREQSRFNSKVLRNLGLLNSQIHLVGMLEAIKDNPVEMKLFNNQIPSVARALIPVWRANFYQPRTNCFDS